VKDSLVANESEIEELRAARFLRKLQLGRHRMSVGLTELIRERRRRLCRRRERE